MRSRHHHPPCARGGCRTPSTSPTGARGRARAALPLAALLAGCVPASRYRAPQAVPLGGDATAAALLGDWVGRYDSPMYDRRGGLTVSLRRGGRGVVGAVTLDGVPGAPDDRGAPERARTPTASVALAIDSAQVGAGRVVLWLRPYGDPGCGCTVAIRLDGALAADTLGGRLRADAAATVAPERGGGWRVIRAASAHRARPGTSDASPASGRVPPPTRAFSRLP